MTIEVYFFIALGVLVITWSFASLFKKLPGQTKTILMLICSIALVSSFYLLTYQSVSNYQEAKIEEESQRDKVLEALVEYVESNPSDAQAIKVIAEYNLELGDYDEAYRYYQQAYLANDSSDISIIIGLVESTLLTRPEVLIYDLNDLINKALAINPIDQRALWFGGLIARANGDQELARTRWLKLLEDSELSVDMRQAINEQLTLMN
jgi:cytochrome c-type biogenesis protein CcmH/NrfG